MKTLLYLCDAMGILGGLLGSICSFIEGNSEVGVWAFAAFIWALASLIKDFVYFNDKA